MAGNRYLAEAVGTFALVFCGCCAIVTNDLSEGALGHAGVSAVFGLIVMAMIYAIGNISGAHLNPAVTLGFFFAKRLNAGAVLPYILSQCAGALVAGFLLKWLFPDHQSLGATSLNVTVGTGLVLEILFTFLLMLVILNVSTGHKETGMMAGVAVGGTVALVALMGGPLTGASMNPARSLGPAIASANATHLWVYLAGPLIGAFLAHPTCRWIQGKDCCIAEDCD